MSLSHVARFDRLGATGTSDYREQRAVATTHASTSTRHMPPTIEATVANKMDSLFTLRKLMDNRALQPAVHVGNHTTTVAGCTTSAEVSSAIQGIVDRAVGKGEDAFVLAEVSLGQDLPRKDAMCVRVHTPRTRVRTFVQPFSGDSRDAMVEVRTGDDE